MKRPISLSSIVFMLLGAIAIIFAVRGILIGNVPFIGRNDIVYTFYKSNSTFLFWAIEFFYIFGGIVSFLYGANSLREGSF